MNVCAIGCHAAQLGSSVMMFAGPLSSALASPKVSVVGCGPPSPASSRVTEIVMAAVTPTTTSNTTAAGAHFQPFPRFLGGRLGSNGGSCGVHCCGGGHGGC